MMALTLILLALGLVLLSGHRSRAVGRLQARRPRRPDRSGPPAALGRAAAVALAATAVVLLTGGVTGVVLGGAVAVVSHRLLGRLEPAASRMARERRAADLPVVLDLLAVCLRAGKPLVLAMEIVADALPGPLAADLAAVAGLQRLGADPAAAWCPRSSG
jgi:Flp pilus assembly protein TadB